MDLNEYYRHPIVQRGLGNFFSGCNWFLTSGSHYSRDPNWGKEPYVRVFPMEEFSKKLGQGPDIFRPLISQNGVLGVFDIEYSNWDKKTLFLPMGEGGFKIHHDIFKRELEPVYQKISQNLGAEIIADMTWSGYHFLTEIDRGSLVYNELMRLGWQLREDGTPKCLENQLVQAYDSIIRDDLKRTEKISLSDGVVYQMFGRVLEYLSHKVMKEVKSQVSLPITFCDTDEICLSLDISQYSDPVYMRIIRSIFSSWDKHNIIDSLSQMVKKPAFLDVIRKDRDYENNDLDHIFHCTQDYSEAINYEQRFDGTIPKAGKKILELILEYEHSKLFEFHREFDRINHDSNDDMYKLAKFDHRIDWDIRRWMEEPNPNLLSPVNLRTVVRNLLSIGWEPKHIGGMLAGRYEADGKGWDKKYWSKYSSRTRANFWARIYSGLELCPP